MNVLDPIDAKIIGLLFEDSRNNFSDIGKQIGISKNAVWSRFKRLSQLQVIIGATVQINYKKLGYDAVAGLALDIEASHIGEVSKYIKARVPDVFGPFVAVSNHNLRIVVTLKTIRELGELKEELRSLSGVNGLVSTIWTDVWFTPENLSLVPNRPIEQRVETYNQDIFDADETDIQLIRTLTEDSRLSFRAIAKKLDISPETVTKRYERLKKEYIIASRIKFDPLKIGYSAECVLSMNIRPKYKIDNIIKEIIEMENVFYTMKCVGEFHLSVMVLLRDIQDLLKFNARVSQIPGTLLLETNIAPVRREFPGPRTYTSSLGTLRP